MNKMRCTAGRVTPRYPSTAGCLIRAAWRCVR